MSSISSQQFIGTHRVRGYTVKVERITWNNSPGLSFDLYEQDENGDLELLNDESWDEYPTRDQMLEALSEHHGDLLCAYPSCSEVWRTTVDGQKLCRRHAREYRAFLKEQA